MTAQIYGERLRSAFSVLPTGTSGHFKGWVWPMPIWNGRKPVISQGFKPSPDPRWGMKHPGVDIMYRRLPNEPARLPEGSKGYFVPSNRIPVFAAGNGIVVSSGPNKLGHHVIINHGNGYHTFYQHLTAKGLPPKSTRVTAGTPIGFVGHNPAGYRLNHLHFEIWQGWRGGKPTRKIDPGTVLRGPGIRPQMAPVAPARRPTTPGPRIAASVTPGIRNLKTQIVRIANQEWNRWNRGGRKLERDPRMRSTLQDYWQTGARQRVNPSDLGTTTWQARYPWSAAFISWVMRRAGAGNAFRYSASHSAYIKAAKDNRLANNKNPFKAYRITEVKPEPGDLVCRSRAGSGATYDNIRVGMKTHCDVVTQVQPGRLTTIGGNVRNSVSKTTVRTNASGHIIEPNYFAVIKLVPPRP